MEKIECKSCSAVVDKSIEFCSSCGDWLGLSLQDMEKEQSTQEDKIQRTTRVPEQLLNKPLSKYGATPMPSRKEVPGIRAVFFLTFLIPVIALASYFYNLNISEEVIEEVEVIQQITTTSSTTTIQDILRKAYPVSCSASSSYSAMAMVILVKIFTTKIRHLGKIMLFNVKMVGLNSLFLKKFILTL